MAVPPHVASYVPTVAFVFFHEDKLLPIMSVVYRIFLCTRS
jgi:hypothetical protein